MNPITRTDIGTADPKKDLAKSTISNGRKAKVTQRKIISAHAAAKGRKDVIAEMAFGTPLVLNGENKSELHTTIRALEAIVRDKIELIDTKQKSIEVHKTIIADQKQDKLVRKRKLHNSVHDFKEALTLVECGLSAAMADPENISSNLNIVKRGALNLNQQASNMLLDARDIELTRTFVDIGVVVNNLAELFKLSYEHFDITSDITPATVSADVVLLERAIKNLILNAVKFTPRGGKIHLSVTKENGKVLISVKDTGIGIRKDKLEQIFEREYTGDSQRGSGLGLSSAKKIIELHNGDLTVASELGQGSEFTITLFPLDPGLDYPMLPTNSSLVKIANFYQTGSYLL